VVDELGAHDLVDQYRLLVFPAVLGEGRRLFERTGWPVDLELVSAESEGQAVRLVYDREPAMVAPAEREGDR
jgi:dihydrofolate reductase